MTLKRKIPAGMELRPPLLTVAATAGVLGTSTKTVRRKIETGELAVIRVGRLLRVSPEDLERYIARHRHG